MNSLLKSYMDELKSIETVEEYEAFIHRLIQNLQQEKFDGVMIQSVRNKGRYMANEFSDTATKKNMLRAKENLLFYLESSSSENQGDFLKYSDVCLEKYLNNFYLFLEAFKEMIPDKRASLTADDLQKIKIENEYDLQHLLYAALRPLYGDIRREVTEDSGVGAIRSDLKIPSLNAVIEAKCSRKSMNLKMLTEQIEADIVHYKADSIYFYIYDKEKVIKDRAAFETYFNRSFDGKRIRIIILQPVNL